MLNKLGIIVGKNTKAGIIFNSLLPSFLDVNYSTPSEYISIYWQKYLTSPNTNNNLNGKIFEYILATLCVRENILPFYMSANVAFVPNAIYDIMFYTKEFGPVCWSIKTSLRERYKQADLEAIVLKQVHRKSLSFLITLEKREALSVKRKIEAGDVIGLDDVIVATSQEFDKLISNMKSFSFDEPPTLKAIDSNQIITLQKLESILKSS